MNRRGRPGSSVRLLPFSLLVSAFLCIACALAGAQASQSSGGSELDNLFNDGGTSPPAPSAGSDQAAEPVSPQAPAAPAVRADDLTRDDKLHYFGSLEIYGLAGLGWSQIPNIGDILQGFGPEASGSLTATLGAEIRPAPELRLRGTLRYNFPTTGPQLSELIVDYTVLNSVFFRLGIFDYTWGNSQFFQFGNLPLRGLPGWGISNVPIWQKANILTQTISQVLPVSFKVYAPFGVNGLTFLARFDMIDYMPNPTTPDPRDAGYGLQYDLVTGPIQWTLAGFYQKLLTPRSSLAMKTNLFGFDFSVETTMAFPVEFLSGGVVPIVTSGGGIYVGGPMQRIYPTVVAGLSREWTDAHIKFYMEYAFNGERDPGTSWLTDETGPGGHNSAVVLRFANLGSSGISLNMVWQQNWSDGSGLVSPLFEISPVPLATIQLGPVLVFGSDNSEVMNNRIVPGGKNLELLLLVKVNDSFRQ